MNSKNEVLYFVVVLAVCSDLKSLDGGWISEVKPRIFQISFIVITESLQNQSEGIEAPIQCSKVGISSERGGLLEAVSRTSSSCRTEVLLRHISSGKLKE